MPGGNLGAIAPGLARDATVRRIAYPTSIASRARLIRAEWARRQHGKASILDLTEPGEAARCEEDAWKN